MHQTLVYKLKGISEMPFEMDEETVDLITFEHPYTPLKEALKTVIQCKKDTFG